MEPNHNVIVVVERTTLKARHARFSENKRRNGLQGRGQLLDRDDDEKDDEKSDDDDKTKTTTSSSSISSSTSIAALTSSNTQSQSATATSSLSLGSATTLSTILPPAPSTTGSKKPAQTFAASSGTTSATSTPAKHNKISDATIALTVLAVIGIVAILLGAFFYILKRKGYCFMKAAAARDDQSVSSSDISRDGVESERDRLSRIWGGSSTTKTETEFEYPVVYVAHTSPKTGANAHLPNNRTSEDLDEDEIEYEKPRTPLPGTDMPRPPPRSRWLGARDSMVTVSTVAKFQDIKSWASDQTQRRPR